MRTYTTVQGDKWDSIAHRELKSTGRTGELMRLNAGHLDKYTFPAGVVLKLPEDTESVESGSGEEAPPWRRAKG